MNRLNHTWTSLLILIVGPVVGTLQGTKARRKWIFRIKRSSEERRQRQEREKLLRSGSPLLDDIELAAFHQ